MCTSAYPGWIVATVLAEIDNTSVFTAQVFPWKLQAFNRLQSSKWLHWADSARSVVEMVSRFRVLPVLPSSQHPL
jgi:hypothetical protein